MQPFFRYKPRVKNLPRISNRNSIFKILSRCISSIVGMSNLIINRMMCLLGLRGEMKIFGDFPAIELFTDEIFSYENDTFKCDAWK